MKQMWFIATRDLRSMLKQRETLLWVFLMPVLFIAFIGNMTQGMSGPRSTGPTPIALIAPPNGDLLADELERRLGDNDYAVARFSTRGEAAEYSRKLTVPVGVTESLRTGQEVTVYFEAGRSGLTGNFDSFRVGRAVYTVLADWVAAGRLDLPRSAEGFASLAEQPRRVSLDVSIAGTRVKIPNGFEQAVPGILVMFILLVMATSGAVILVTEREQGLLRRLASAPISRRSIVGGKWLARLSLGVLQIVFAMAIGAVLFQVDWGANVVFVFLTLLVYGAMMAALGLLLGNLVRTQKQAVAIGVISSNVLGALGGCWWPIEITPPIFQTIAKLLPTGWAMDAMHELVSFGAPVSAVLPHCLGMLAATVLLLGTAARIFRFEN